MSKATSQRSNSHIPPPIRPSISTRKALPFSTPKRAVESLGMQPIYVFSNGGLDANWLDKHGVPTVTIGAGQFEIHTLKEYVDLDEFAKGCQLAIALATMS